MDRYTCEEVFRRLDDYLDRELGAAEMNRVQQHLEICAICAQEFAFEQSLLQSLRQKVKRIAVPPGLKTRLSQALSRAEHE